MVARRLHVAVKTRFESRDALKHSRYLRITRHTNHRRQARRVVGRTTRIGTRSGRSATRSQVNALRNAHRTHAERAYKSVRSGRNRRFYLSVRTVMPGGSSRRTRFKTPPCSRNVHDSVAHWEEGSPGLHFRKEVSQIIIGAHERNT